MRILMIVLNDMTHDSRVSREAGALAEAGHEVVVHCLGGQGLPVRRIIDGYQVRRHDLWTRPLPKRPLWQWFKYAEFLMRVLLASLRFRPQVVHSHDVNALLIGWPCACLNHGALIYDSHELCLETNTMLSRPSLERRIWAWLESKAAPRAQQVITVSPGLAKVLQERYGVQPVILVNAPAYSLAGSRSSLKADLGLSHEHRLLLYHGALGVHRGIEQAMEALARLPVSYHLGCMGPLNDYAKGLPVLAEHLGIEERFHLVSAVGSAQVVPTIAGADLGLALIQPSSRNHLLGMPNKILECMAAGLPFLYSDFPAYRAFLGDAGIPCDPTDPGQIADTILSAFGQDEYLIQKAEKGRRQFADGLSWDAQRLKLLALYQGLVSERA